MSVRVSTAESEQEGPVIDLRRQPHTTSDVWGAVCAGAPQPAGGVAVEAPAPSVAQQVVGVVDAVAPQTTPGETAVSHSAEPMRAALAAATRRADHQRARIMQDSDGGSNAAARADRIGRWAELAATVQALSEQLRMREARAWRRRQGLKRRLELTDAVGNAAREQCAQHSGPPGVWSESSNTTLQLLQTVVTPAPVVIDRRVAPAMAYWLPLQRWLGVPAVIVA